MVVCSLWQKIFFILFVSKNAKVKISSMATLHFRLFKMYGLSLKDTGQLIRSLMDTKKH